LPLAIEYKFNPINYVRKYIYHFVFSFVLPNRVCSAIGTGKMQNRYQLMNSKTVLIMEYQNGILTAILFLAYLTLWKIKRSEILKSDGIDVNVIFKVKSPIQKYFGILEKVMTILIVLIIIIHIFFKDYISITHYINKLDTILIKAIGFVIGIVGLAICRIAQVTIGKSWRVGIDEQAKPGLITHGIYKYIRNPTYSGLYLLVIGVWLINPTILYSYWILAFFLMMEFQVRCEEEYLESQYGNDYSTYCKKTKRYIPGVY